jgi:hypothetical protein
MASKRTVTPRNSQVELTPGRIAAESSVDTIKTWQQSHAHFVGTIDTLLIGLATFAIARNEEALAWGALGLVAASLAVMVLLARWDSGAQTNAVTRAMSSCRRSDRGSVTDSSEF